ncbi:unnamed protein product, partial [Symbiodinium sp. KB8]
DAYTDDVQHSQRMQRKWQLKNGIRQEVWSFQRLRGAHGSGRKEAAVDLPAARGKPSETSALWWPSGTSQRGGNVPSKRQLRAGVP